MQEYGRYMYMYTCSCTIFALLYCRVKGVYMHAYNLRWIIPAPNNEQRTLLIMSLYVVTHFHSTVWVTAHTCI